LMLLAEFEQIVGRPNQAWLTGGAAVHKAISIGLHRELIHSNATSKSAEQNMSHRHERQMTFWSLYAYERVRHPFFYAAKISMAD
jgi:hypothetical protein